MKETPSPVLLAGICGGVAAFKAVEALSRLRKGGYAVHVAMTHAAQRFVTPLTFSAVTGHPVLTQMFPDTTGRAGDELYPHLYPATRSDVFLLLPATANMIARIAQGLGDDVVSTSALSLPATCRRVFCPAMNVEMWNQPVVQANVAAMERMGWIRIGPNAGILACGMEGQGRMSEPQEIVDAVVALEQAGKALKNRRVLIVSGPTREHLDPVRFIGNPSTGKMGKALAEEASAAGANVEFVSGPVAENNLPRGAGIRLHPVVSAEDMLKAAQGLYGKSDIVIYAAAVADYKPAEYHAEKMPKKVGEMTIKLEATPDVSATLNASKRPGQVAIGFALQTHDGLKLAQAKLQKKQLDGIVLNSLDALGGESGTYTYIHAANGKEGQVSEWGTLDKRTCARRILAEAAHVLQKQDGGPDLSGQS